MKKLDLISAIILSIPTILVVALTGYFGYFMLIISQNYIKALGL